MARTEYAPDKFDAVATELQEAVDSLKLLAKLLRDSQMPHALVHGTTAENFHIPAVIDWIGKTTVDVKTQLRAFSAGIQSRAELQKKYNDNQKLAAAKKPWKKSVKKKTTGKKAITESHPLRSKIDDLSSGGL